MQTLSLDMADAAGKPARKRIETRLLVRQQGEWTGYSYRWNAAQTDAELVPAAGTGVELEVADPIEPGGRREQTWRFPARTECMVCHSRASGFTWASAHSSSTATAITAAPSTTSSARSSTSACSRVRCPGRRDDRPRLVNPYEAQAPLEARVKSYLHVNCSTCHVKEGGGNARMELGLTTPTRQDAPDRRSSPPRPLRHPRRPPRRPRLARALRALPPDLAAGPARCRPWCPPRSTARRSS